MEETRVSLADLIQYVCLLSSGFDQHTGRDCDGFRDALYLDNVC